MSDSGTSLYSKTFGRLFDKIRPEIWGFITSGILLTFVLPSRIGYVGTAGEPYSFLNHYISELGEVGVSHLAPLFNTGLILGGFASVVFMVGLGMYIKNTAAKIGMGVGVFSGIACSLVGFFPMNNLHIHTIVATCFFFSGMLVVAMFSVAIAKQKEAKIPRPFSLVGVVVVGVFIAFLVDAYAMGHGVGHGPLGVISSRPHIWWRPLLEWSVFVAIVGWMLLASVCMYIVNRKLGDRSARIRS
jgi:hypothetical membrane protein